MTIRCQMEKCGSPVCKKDATWKVWFKRNPQESAYLCDECVAMVAKYDMETGNQLQGKPLPVNVVGP